MRIVFTSDTESRVTKDMQLEMAYHTSVAKNCKEKLSGAKGAWRGMKNYGLIGKGDMTKSKSGL